MPKTTTAAFDKEWADRTKRNAVWKVTYKRLYWSGSAYVLESSARTLYPRDIEKISPISWKTDEAQESRFLASNVTLYLRNRGELWLPENLVDSIWKPDATATLGYEPYLSWFQVHYGYLLPDGTSEYLALFTGYSEVPRFNSETGLVEVRLVGREIKLEAAKGSQVSTTFTNESAGTGDGATLRFSTGQKSVFEVSRVRVAGTTKTQGTHYTLEDANDADNLCYIVFTAGNAPANLAAVDWTGRQWKRLSKVSTVAGLLCDAAGITSGERTIEEPNWPTTTGNFLIDTQADWEAGTALTDIDTTTIPGSIQNQYVLDDFNDGNYDGWTVKSGSWSAATFALVAGGAGVISRPLTVPTVFAIEVKITPSANGAIFWLHGSVDNETGNGYGLLIDFDMSSTTLYLVRYDAGVATTLGTHVISAGVDTGPHTYRVYRTALSAFTVTLDGMTVITATDATYTSGAYVILRTVGAGDAYDDIRFNKKTAVPYESAVFDMLAAPNAWGILERSATVPSGWAVAYSTSVSNTAGSGYDAYVAIAADGTIQSALKRYLKIKITITPPAALGDFQTCSVESVRAYYFTSDLFLQHADFTGMNARQGLDDLAVLGNMEHGFNGDGTYFFRNKETTPSYSWTLDLKNALASVPEVDRGIKEVRNVIQATYNDYFYEYNSTTAGESSPTSQEKNGDRVESMSLDRFAFANGVSLVQASARKVYADRSVRKRRIRSEGRIIPAMNLGDGARLSAIKTPLLEKVIFGDEHQTDLGFMGSATAGPSNVLLRDVPAKVVGVSFDVMRSRQQTFYREVV